MSIHDLRLQTNCIQLMGINEMTMLIKKPYGFTLIELMFVVFLLSILSFLAIPSFQSLIAQNRLTSTTNQLLGSLQLARSEAVKRAKDVRLVVLDGGWSEGWRIETFDADTGVSDEVIRLFSAIPAAVNITGDEIVYSASGSADSACYELNTPILTTARYIELIASGFSRVTDEDCNG